MLCISFSLMEGDRPLEWLWCLGKDHSNECEGTLGCTQHDLSPSIKTWIYHLEVRGDMHRYPLSPLMSWWVYSQKCQDQTAVWVDCVQQAFYVFRGGKESSVVDLLLLVWEEDQEAWGEVSTFSAYLTFSCLMCRNSTRLGGPGKHSDPQKDRLTQIQTNSLINTGNINMTVHQLHYLTAWWYMRIYFTT